MKREELLANLDIGNAIKKLRERNGLSQEELAKGICDRTNITKLENGYSKIPSLSFVLLICERLEITIQEFLNFAMNNNYTLDKEKILDYLMNKNYIDLNNYINQCSYNLLSNIDKKYYNFIKGIIHLTNGEIAKGKDYLLPLDNLPLDDYISVLSHHELIKHQCIDSKTDHIYQINFIQSLINKKTKNEYLYFINDLIEKYINYANELMAKILLEKEIEFINSHNLYKYLPIYYKNKIKLFNDNDKIIKEIENKLFYINSNKRGA